MGEAPGVTPCGSVDQVPLAVSDLVMELPFALIPSLLQCIQQWHLKKCLTHAGLHYQAGEPYPAWVTLPRMGLFTQDGQLYSGRVTIRDKKHVCSEPKFTRANKIYPGLPGSFSMSGVESTLLTSAMAIRAIMAINGPQQPAIQ